MTTGAWCDYNNAASNGITYGHLYNWYAVNDRRSLCPRAGMCRHITNGIY